MGLFDYFILKKLIEAVLGSVFIDMIRMYHIGNNCLFREVVVLSDKYHSDFG